MTGRGKSCFKTLYGNLKRALSGTTPNISGVAPERVRNLCGFTMVEVMVSAAILSVCLVLVLNSFIMSLRVIELSEDYFKASLLMERKIFEEYMKGVKPCSLEEAFTDFDGRFKWVLNVKELEDEALDEVSLDVLWEQGSKKQSMSLVTYFGRY